MIKTFGKALLAVTLAGTVAGMAQAEDKVLHVYNWSDYIAPDTVEKFDQGNRHQGRLRRLRLQRDPGSQAPDRQVRLRHRGAVQQLPRQADQGRRVPEAGQVQAAELEEPRPQPDEDRWKTPIRATSTPSPTCGESIGIGYNPEKVKAVLGENAPVDSWDLLFKPENIEKLKSCGVSFLDSPTEILPIALQYLGYSPVSQDAKELKEAEALFLKIPSAHHLLPTAPSTSATWPTATSAWPWVTRATCTRPSPAPKRPRAA